MIPTCIVLVALLMATPARGEWTEQDAGQCRASGRFVNGYYGFSVPIPAGLHGCPNSPVGMTDHGLVIPLSSDEPERSIECFAAYNVLFHKTPAEAAKFWLDSVREHAAPRSTKVLRRSKTKLGGLVALRTVVHFSDKASGTQMIRDNTVALRRVMKDYPTASHEYSVDLTTPAKDYDHDVAILNTLLSAWKVGPTADD